MNKMDISGSNSVERTGAMADHTTPLLKNHWYVAAYGYEVSRTLLQRWLLGRNVVLYRTESGEPVALQNRCAHRSFPLSEGKLVGDELQCGYHGIRYDTEGKGVEVPCQDKCPASIAVQSFPLMESGPYIWIWMGDPELADPALVPDHPWVVEPDWDYAKGYFLVEGNYLLMHENLLDLTHFMFLHGDALGSDEYASAPFEMTVDDGSILCRRDVQGEVPPVLYDKTMQLGGRRTDRLSGAHFVSPAFHVGSAVVTDHVTDDRSNRQFNTRVLHALTPATQSTTHYFWSFARDYEIGNKQITDYMGKMVLKAFEEDLDAVRWMQENLENDTTESFVEQHIKADRPGVTMRRIIQNFANEEASA